MAFKQNLSGAQGGTIQGAHGGTQQLGAAARSRLGVSGPNTAGGGLNPTPPTMDPAQKPPPWQALQQAGIGGQGSAAANRAAAAGLQPQTKPMPLPGFRPMPGAGSPLQIMDGAPGTVAFPGGGGGQGIDGAGIADLQGHAPTFGSGAMQGVGDAMEQQAQHGGGGAGNPMQGIGNVLAQMQLHGGAPGGANPDAVRMMGGEMAANEGRGGVGPVHPWGTGGPLPGFQAAPGTMGTNGGPLMSLPGPMNKFPPRPGMQTKPLPMPTPDTPQVRPQVGGGGLSPGGPIPRNNMARY